MRIMHVIHDFLPSNRGGSELYTYHLSKELSANHDVGLFFTIPDNGGKERVVHGNYDGIPYWALKKNRIAYSRSFQDRNGWVEKQFTHVLQEYKPDIIHFQHLINLFLNLPSIAKKRCIPSCLTLHDFWFLCPRIDFLTSELVICKKRSPTNCLECFQIEMGYYATHYSSVGLWHMSKREVKRFLNIKKKAIVLLDLALWRTHWVRKVFRDVGIFIAPSRFLQEKYIQNGLAREKIVFIRHGFNKNIFNGIKRIKSQSVRFGFIGTIRPHKGIILLIDAFNKVKGSAELKIYGRIPEQMMGELKQRITNHAIHLMGELREENKREAFSKIDVLIVPSLCYENCPLTINEAFLAGIPVITTNIGGMAELVKEGENGFVFPVGNSEKLAEKIELCIENPKLIDQLSSNMPEVKDMKTHTEEIVKLYTTLTNMHS